jgi:hypothetical protein
MCRRAELVCPNSVRISEYLIHEAACDPRKIQIVPNATRDRNIPAQPIIEPAPLPPDSEHLKRPMAGVVGNMAANIDWVLLEQVIHRATWLSWVFVGPSSMPISDGPQRRARARLMDYGGRVLFVGEKPYEMLVDYARSFDVAILPYLKREPTYSGSSTRFYEHLAACRPMLATRGFHELHAKQEFLRLFDTPEQLITLLLELRTTDFIDGREHARWLASRYETWSRRAGTLLQAFQSRTNTSRT